MEDICVEQELISMSGEIFKEEKNFTQHDVGKMSIIDENEKQNKLLNNDKNANAKNKKISTYTKKKKKKDENKNILLQYMRDVDDKLFKKYSNGKNFNSFINEFDRATNKEDKEKVAKELKDINNLVEHYIEMDESNEYRSKLFDIANTIEYFLYEYSKK